MPGGRVAAALAGRRSARWSCSRRPGTSRCSSSGDPGFDPGMPLEGSRIESPRPERSGRLGSARKALASSLLAFGSLRARGRGCCLLHGRLLLQFALIVIDGGTDEIFQGTRINLVTLEKLDRSPRAACEPRAEELVWLRELHSVG